MKQGKVYLIGAGPGDPGLITAKGLWHLRHGEVIVYDYLASNALLNEVSAEAELIYAGKRSGHHHMIQEEIQNLLIAKAREGKVVIRLKGGDPFIFGRGGEEALALREARIDFEVVPGVSSAYSVPASAGIPVTHRGVAAQVHFITGHGQTEQGLDYEKLAKMEGTLVFLMGIQRISEIADGLMRFGKSEKTPAAVIRNGTTGYQEEVFADLKEIASAVRKQRIQPPGILVVGDTAELASKIQWRKKGPLSGKRILLTGSRELVQKQHQSLQMTGGEPVDMSLIQIEPAESEQIKEVLENLANYDWLAFTSSQGVGVFFEHIKKYGIDFRKMSHLKFAVVGSGTGRALREQGFIPDYMPETYTSEDLAKGLADVMDQDEKLMVFRAEEGSKILNQYLDRTNVSYRDFAAYRTKVDWRKKDLLLRAMEEADYVTFASGSAVRAYKAMAGDKVGPKVVCIGPVTADVAKNAGLIPDAVAKIYTISGLTECLCHLAEMEE